jgi:hypothetical protein
MYESITVRIVDEIADQRDVKPTELGYAIHDHIETDALRLLANSDTGPWTLSFECPDGTVTVTRDGGIYVDFVPDHEQVSSVFVN